MARRIGGCDKHCDTTTMHCPTAFHTDAQRGRDQCGSHMGTKFWKAVCNENGIGDGGEYCSGNDAQHGRINVLYRKASGGKYVPRAGPSTSNPA
jgi:hypothetical protein